MNLPQEPPISLWDKWLAANGVDDGYGYRVPDEVWNAAWCGNWPDDEETIQWILEEYLGVEKAKANGYLKLVLRLREEAEAALQTARNKAEQQRQIKIDADIDEVIKTIEALRLESDQKPKAVCNCGEKSRRKYAGWLQSEITLIAIALAGVAGLVGGYNLHAWSHPAEIPMRRPPEIRRAIAVEPEIRRAIPVYPEIRKAIPVRIARNSGTLRMSAKMRCGVAPNR